MSVVLDTALGALIDRELERRWLAAHQGADVPVDVPVELSGLPWDDE